MEVLQKQLENLEALRRSEQAAAAARYREFEEALSLAESNMEGLTADEQVGKRQVPISCGPAAGRLRAGGRGCGRGLRARRRGRAAGEGAEL